MCKERIKLKKINFWEKFFNFFHNSKKFLIVTFLDEFDPVLFIYALKSDPRGLTEVLYKYKQSNFDGLANARLHAAIRWSWVRVSQEKNYNKVYQS